MKTKLLFLCLTVSTTLALAQSPDWTNIKANATFNYDTATYNAPYILPLNVGGWEDGLFITRDGLNLYAFYMPVDLFSWKGDIDWSKPCPFPFLEPYYRGPLFGMDTITSPPQCTGWNQSDIVYASRPDISSPFTTWTLSNLATSLTSEGAPHSIPQTSSTADIFVFNRDNGATSIDIMMMKSVPNNPSASSAVPILATDTTEEGNPHIERIDSLNLVIFFNNEEIPSTPPDIFFSTSNDNGNNWQTPQSVTSINSQYYELQPHLYHDGTDWWLYFAAADTLGTGLLSIFKAKQTILGNWNSWGARQFVIGPNSITGGYGQIGAIGEPTLTQWGDLSFVVIYSDTNSTDTMDVFDADPWFLPNKTSPTSVQSISEGITNIELHPNPMLTYTNLQLNNKVKNATLTIYDSFGRAIKQIKNISGQTIMLHRDNLPVGLYFIRMTEDSKLITTGKLVITD